MPIDEEMNDLNADEDLIPKDVRRPRSILDSRIQRDGELSDSDDEGEGGRRDHASYKKRRVRSPSRDPVHGSILTAGPAHAGPSGQTTVAKVLAKMEVDEPEESNMRMETPAPPSEAPTAAPNVERSPVPVPPSEPELEPGRMLVD